MTTFFAAVRLGHLRGPGLHAATCFEPRLPLPLVLLLHGDALDPQLQHADVLGGEAHPMALHCNAGEDVLDPLAALVAADLEALGHPTPGLQASQVALDLLQAEQDGCGDLGRVRLVDPDPRDLRRLVHALGLQELQLEVVHLGEGLANLQQGDVLWHLLDLVHQLGVRHPLAAVHDPPVDVQQVPEDGQVVAGVHPHLGVDVHDNSQQHVHDDHDNPDKEQEHPNECRPPLPSRELFPIILALNRDLQAHEDGILGPDKVDDAAAEDHHPREREPEDRHHPDDGVVEQVRAASHERRCDGRQARLPLEGNNDLAQEQQCHHGDQRPVKARRVAHHLVSGRAQGFRCCTARVGVKSLKPVLDFGLPSVHDQHQDGVDPSHADGRERQGKSAIHQGPYRPHLECPSHRVDETYCAHYHEEQEEDVPNIAHV
mmetsp:Transcript_60487/g.187363  ORF Transcript_60487/g.187363 Transcript_60487/m.187363 type:complete len:430 (-) Transcript_60487:1444-2733(-)